MRPRSIPPALFLGLLAFVLYSYTAAPDIMFGDSGEFQFTLALAGVSHPTGYPLYHVLGWLWSMLFGLNPAQGANQFSAFWGGVAVATFYLLCYEAFSQFLVRLKWDWGAGWMAIVPTIVFAGNPTFWAQSTRAEVYALNAALVAAVLGATLALGRKDKRPGGAWVVALLFGLGFTHHLTIGMFIPGVFAYVWLVRPDLLRWGKLLRLMPFVLAPLLLYLFIPLRVSASSWLSPTLAPDQTLQLFDTSVLGYIRFILGAGFAPALHSPAAALAQIPVAANLFYLHFGIIGLALIMVGIVGLVLEEQVPVLVLSAMSFILLVGFNLFYGIGDIHTFYIPPYLIATLWLGYGLIYVVDLLTRFTGTRSRPYLMAFTLIALLIPLLAFRNYRADFDRNSDYNARITWTRILDHDLPENAIVVSNDRDEMVPLVYLQQIENQATGMSGLFPLIHPDPAWADLNETLRSALATGRPVYVIKPMPGAEALFEVEELEFGVTRILAEHPTPEGSFEMPHGDALRWLDIDWKGDSSPGGELIVTLTWRAVDTPTTPLHSFLQIYNADGEKVKQADDHRPGGDYIPATLWRSGDVIIDTFTLPLPDVLPPGDYTLVAGFYDPTTGERVAPPMPVASLISPALYE
ncbi:MAG: DUF2723 domain-containing protein [Chloroflexi bacterium]|nr:DUF2723 domain-containing protein [Chloroflexota bacterium]